jgi:uncharacterized protein (DUF302 family)
MKEELLIKRRSRGTLEAVCERLPVVSQSHGFGVLGVHDLKQKMISKGVDFDGECRVFEVCNPHKAKEVLSQSMAVSTALPCRISVYEENGAVVLATLKPTMLLPMFDIPEAVETAAEVEKTLLAIMDEVAAG